MARSLALALVPLSVLSACGQIQAPSPTPSPTTDASLDDPPGRPVTIVGAPPTFIAIQNDDGPFLPDNRVFSSSDRFGVAIGCIENNVSTVTILHRAVAEGFAARGAEWWQGPGAGGGTRSHGRGEAVDEGFADGGRGEAGGDGLEIASPCRAPAQSAITLTFDIRGTQGDEPVVMVRAAHGETGRVRDGLAQLRLPAGRTDLVAIMFDHSSPGFERIIRIPAVDVRRDETIALDFATQSLPLAANPLQLSIPEFPSNGSISIGLELVTADGTYPITERPLGSTYPILDPTQRRPGDAYRIRATGPDRSTTLTTTQPGSVSLTLRSRITAPPPALLPGLRPQFSFAPVAPISPAATQRYTLTAQTAQHRWRVELSPAWIGDGPVSYALPDLSAVPDFAAETFSLHERTAIEWAVTLDETEPTPSGSMRSTSSATGRIGEFCGDGIQQTGEACDASGADTRDCDSDCTRPSCGDGHLNPASETCDPPDGNSCGQGCIFLG